MCFIGTRSQRRRSTARRLSTDSRSDTAYWQQKSRSKSPAHWQQKSRSKSPPSLSKCTLFVKMPDANAYYPINVRRKTVRHLLEAIQLKCSSFLPHSIESIYLKKPDGKMLFHLDDDMMAYMENQQIFNLELQEKSNDSEKFDMTLSEVKS